MREDVEGWRLFYDDLEEREQPDEEPAKEEIEQHATEQWLQLLKASGIPPYEWERRFGVSGRSAELACLSLLEVPAREQSNLARSRWEEQQEK